MKDLVTARRVGAFVVSVLAVSALVGSAREGCPDTLELQDGIVIVGLYVGGTEDAVRFRVHDDVRTFGRRDVKQLTFTPVAAVAPPLPRVEQSGPAPDPGRVQIPGRWHWDDLQRRYTWLDGHWEAAREGWVWVPGQWEHRPWGWVWVDGTWRRR